MVDSRAILKYDFEYVRTYIFIVFLWVNIENYINTIIEIFSKFYWLICHSCHMLSSLHKQCFDSKISSVGQFIYSYANHIILIIVTLSKVLLSVLFWLY